MSIADRLLEWVFHYSYWGLFASMSLGIVGLPMPDEVLLTAAGYLLAQGEMRLGWTMLAAVGGSVVGMSLSYWIGRSAGVPLLQKYGGRIGLTSRRMERHERLFAKWGQAFILIGYFMPGLRHVTALLTGVAKRPYRIFVLYAAIGALLWTSAFELIGALLGDHWQEAAQLVHRDFVYVLAGGAVMAAGFFWLRRIAARSERL